ncbi:e3 ubiquitin-protein ligase [Anaeramoeba flamelloides]|uniref:E3 ubiquitin-protein ligase n=1 Tax=Anaeramoeba flamelloides TaxID=1746091 RepID=A0ABQ8YK96_9EUKA|nr:e3 ubiquitin-protein ligase [Anaeramoeba flamelloides]
MSVNTKNRIIRNRSNRYQIRSIGNSVIGSRVRTSNNSRQNSENDDEALSGQSTGLYKPKILVKNKLTNKGYLQETNTQKHKQKKKTKLNGVQKKTEKEKDQNENQIQKEKEKEKEKDQTKVQECFLCCNPIEIYSISPCNHNFMCYKCSLRLGLYQKERHCCYCKQKQNQIILTKNPKLKFEDFNLKRLNYDSKLKVFIDGFRVKSKINELFLWNCHECQTDYPKIYDNAKHFFHHLSTTHHKKVCTICLEYGRIFPSELEYYTKSQLQKHIRQEHSYCKFCDQAFMNEEQLFKHMNDSHFTCHLCEQNENSPDYYKNYQELERHFETQHFLCHHQSCLEKKYIVFHDKFELKTHQISEHCSDLKKNSSNRKIYIDFEQDNYFNTFHNKRNDNRNHQNNYYNSNNNRNKRNNRNNNRNYNKNETRIEKSENQEEKKKEQILRKRLLEQQKRKKEKEQLNRNQKSIEKRKNLQKVVLQKIKKHLRNNKKLQLFAKKSELFQKGKINVTQYHTALYEFFGSNFTNKIFDDLCATLPDKIKRKKLSKLHQQYLLQEKEFPRISQPSNSQRKKKNQTNKPTWKQIVCKTSIK